MSQLFYLYSFTIALTLFMAYIIRRFFTHSKPFASFVPQQDAPQVLLTCKCFLESNIFVQELSSGKVIQKHFNFTSERFFRKDHAQFLARLTPSEGNQLVAQIQQEIQRRKSLDSEAQTRKLTIQKTYTPLHPQVYQLCDDFVTSEAKQMLKTPSKFVSSKDKVFEFPLFTARFCKLLIEELQNFENSNCPKGRPNSMNNYGVLLHELGFSPRFLDALMYEVVKPLAEICLPEYGSSSLDSHKGFVVKYKIGEDVSLSKHFDDAEVTLNVCLGTKFEGGNLILFGMKDDPDLQHDVNQTYEHCPGRALLHAGGRLHLARPITAGERYNLILWCRSSAWRRENGCPMCDRADQLLL